MSEQVEALPAQAIASDSRTTISWRDFLELTKPRVVALMILTSVIGMLLAAPGGTVGPWLPRGTLPVAPCPRQLLLWVCATTRQDHGCTSGQAT